MGKGRAQKICKFLLAVSSAPSFPLISSTDRSSLPARAELAAEKGLGYRQDGTLVCDWMKSLCSLAADQSELLRQDTEARAIL